MNGSRVVGLVRTICYITLTLFIMPVQRLALALNGPLSADLPRRYHGWCCRIFGIKIVGTGMSEMGCEHGGEPRMMVLGQPHRKDVELMIPREHRVEG